MYILKAKNITKYFGDNLVLDAVSLTLTQDNNLVGLIGPNGSGKTTLLKCLAGYLDCEYSTIQLSPNISLAKRRPLYQKSISFIPDTDTISAYLTGREFLDLVIDMRQLHQNSIQEKLQLLCEYYDMSQNLDQLMAEYSHGMIKKIALISGFLAPVKLLLLDEPFNGLDPEMITLTKNLILKYAELGTACIISSHYLQGIEEICSSVIVLDKGRIHYKGAIDSFIQQYQSSNLQTSWIQYLGISDKKDELIQKIIHCH